MQDPGVPQGVEPGAKGEWEAAGHAADTHMRSLGAILPGAFFRLIWTVDGHARLDFQSEGPPALRELVGPTGQARLLTWLRSVPRPYRRSLLGSIRDARSSRANWFHEWPVDTAAQRIWLQGMATPEERRDGAIVWNGLVLDITASRQAAAERDRMHTDYRSIFENTTEGIFRTSRDGRLLDANSPLVRMHGCRSKEELIARVGDLARDWYVQACDRARILHLLDCYGYVEEFEAEVYRIGTGERFWAQENSRAIHDERGNLLYYQGTVRDVTARHRSQRLAERRSGLLERIARDEPLDGILHGLVATLEEYRPRIRAALLRLVGNRITVAAAPHVDLALVARLENRTPQAVGGALAAAAAGESPALQTVDALGDDAVERFQRGMQRAGYVAGLFAAVRDHSGCVLGFVCAFADRLGDADADLRSVLREMAQIGAIALEHHELSRQLIEQAYYDQLTGLPNRFLLADRLDQRIAEANRLGHSLALILIDLDDFKLVNDTLGHTAGDSLLVDIAARLQTCVTGNDTVARFGGDEFVVLLTRADAAVATEVAQRIESALQGHVFVEGRAVNVRATMGISLFPRDGASSDSLLRAADTALYAAKRSPVQPYRFSTDSLNRAVHRRVRVEQELRTAVAGDGLELYYQPRVGLADGVMRGGEALLRWQHPERGLIAPAEFLGVAEQSALMGEIDRYVVAAAVRQAAAWQRRRRPHRVAFNLSAGELHRDDFGNEFARLLSADGADPAAFEIEVTETMIMQDIASATEQLHKLRGLLPGLRIAIDDFGTGQSSLHCLAQLPIDTLKIDRKFVSDLRDAEQAMTAEAIVRTIIELGHSLNLTVVAEGVECAEQAHQLRTLGCCEAQGFYFAEPMAAADFDAWCRG